MKELINIQQALRAPKNKDASRFKYRSAEEIYQSLKPLLKASGSTVIISDTVEAIGGQIYIKATATMTNGIGESVSVSAYAREDLHNKNMGVAQSSGSTSSYARKYAVSGMFLIDDNKDPDSVSMEEQEKADKDYYLANPYLDDKTKEWIRNNPLSNDEKYRLDEIISGASK